MFGWMTTASAFHCRKRSIALAGVSRTLTISPGKRITFSDRVLRNSARSTRSRRFRPKPRRHPRRPISLPTIMQSEPNRGVGQLAVKIYKTALYEIYFWIIVVIIADNNLLLQ